jgi:hypothetical protein
MKKIIFAIFVFMPSAAFANVQINEVAWMGDATSAYNEWIELYNDGDTAEDLSGWSIVTTDGKFSIILSKTIQPKGYFLLEHVKADAAKSTASDVLSYTGTYFNNEGGIILLLKHGDMETDKIDASEKWPAGNSDKAKEETMQRNGEKWITAPSTKGTENKTSDTSSETTDATTDTTNTDTAPYSSSLDTSAHMSPLPLSDFSEKQELYISAGRNRIVSAGNPVIFEAYAIDSKGTKSQNISATWSFGDGSQAGGVKVSHTYKYSGDYAVVLNASTGRNEAVSRAEIKVFAPKITLFAENDGAVSLSNDSAYEINIGGWKIQGTTGTFAVAPDTIIMPGKKIIFPQMIMGINFPANETMSLFSPDGTMVVNFTKSSKPIALIATTTPTEILVMEKKNEEAVSFTPVVLLKPKTQIAAASLVIPEPEKTATTAPAQKIVLKKPEGFFTKLWNFFF